MINKDYYIYKMNSFSLQNKKWKEKTEEDIKHLQLLIKDLELLFERKKLIRKK